MEHKDGVFDRTLAVCRRGHILAVDGAVWTLQGIGAHCGDNVSFNFESCDNAGGHALRDGSIE